VQPFASDPQALFSTKRWYLDGAAAPPLLRIAQAKAHGGLVVASCDDVPDRDAAQALTGATVLVPRSSFPTAGDGEYYWVDLIGCSVVNRDGASLGIVADLLDTGAHSVLRVLAGEVERLIPFVAAYVDDVNLAQRRIGVDWGLDY
jgi:16S rRNA processing protein RimM